MTNINLLFIARYYISTNHLKMNFRAKISKKTERKNNLKSVMDMKKNGKKEMLRQKAFIRRVVIISGIVTTHKKANVHKYLSDNYKEKILYATLEFCINGFLLLLHFLEFPNI